MICPYCAEEIKSEARKCKHCGEWIRESNSSSRPVEEMRPRWYQGPEPPIDGGPLVVESFSSFSIQGRRYYFDDVLRLNVIASSFSMNFVPMSDDIRVLVRFNEAQKLEDLAGFSVSGRKKRRVAEAVSALMQLTRLRRYEDYAERLKSKGCIEYPEDKDLEINMGAYRPVKIHSDARISRGDVSLRFGPGSGNTAFFGVDRGTGLTGTSDDNEIMVGSENKKRFVPILQSFSRSSINFKTHWDPDVIRSIMIDLATEGKVV